MNYEDVLQESITYFEGDELSARVFVDKYALRDNDNNILESTPKDMHRRIAKEFARIESKKFKEPLSEDHIYNLLDGFKYIIPQGSILYGCGNPYQIVSLSNCYVVPSPLDSYGGIIRTDQHLVQISKRRGGVGIDLSNLRPRGSKTRNAARSSTGIVSWMERFSNSIREVGQDGRRGALMLTVSIHHPDILDFVSIKNDPAKVTGANISVRLSNEFLQAVENDSEYELRFPVNSNNIVRKVRAKDVWNSIIHSAWLRAEPGLLFWDNITEYNAVDCYGEFGFTTISTNPCSELPLCRNDSCRLLIQNLFSYILRPFTSSAQFDFVKFAEHTKIAQRLMDDVIDLELEKIDAIIDKIKSDPESLEVKRVELELWEDIRKKCYNGRRTGLGITGLGDTIAAMGFKYDSDEAARLVHNIFMSFKVAALQSSIEMAKEIGPFPIWDWELEKDSPWLLNLLHESATTYEDIAKYGRRNIGHLTIAPTGSMSILTQTTSGVEPMFRLEPYIRRKKINPSDKNAKVDFVDQNGDSWQEFKVYSPKVKMWMEITGETDLTKSPWYNACAEDINWENRVRLQGIIQKYIDHAISSTINLPENVTEEEVAKIYLAAWKNNLKGITVYRNNCRTGVLVDKKEEVKPVGKRPKKLACDIHHPTVKGVKYYVAIGLTEDGSPYEIFAGENGIDKDISKGFIQRIRNGRYSLIADNEVLIEDMGERCSNEEEAVARLASISLRNGVDIQSIVDQLEKTKGSLSGFTKVMTRVLKKYIPDGSKSTELCPECSKPLIYQEGCKKCGNCSWSKC
jgi:ribonucleoside-diphosphate reductase alpha chain